VGAALLPGATQTESRKAVKGLFCATEMDGTYSAWRTRNNIPEERSLGQPKRGSELVSVQESGVQCRVY